MITITGDYCLINVSLHCDHNKRMIAETSDNIKRLIFYLCQFFHVTFLWICDNAFHPITGSFLGKARGKLFPGSIRKKKMFTLNLCDFVYIYMFFIDWTMMLVNKLFSSKGLIEPIVC
jgi:hypothetical protein